MISNDAWSAVLHKLKQLDSTCAWNPRYVAFCCDRNSTEVPMFEFSLWVMEKWSNFAKKHNCHNHRELVMAFGAERTHKLFDDFLGIPSTSYV